MKIRWLKKPPAEAGGFFYGQRIRTDLSKDALSLT
jgi:hypothetical protein